MHIIISADFNLGTGQYNRSVPSPPPASASELFKAQISLRFL